ncbi:MAG TPA: alpha/beta hydrolase [Spirochaetia bacterium]|nr:alpha/beta hydrolase [Spirochaetia bacterium]
MSAGGNPTDSRDFTYRTKDGKEIHATEWFSERGTSPRAIVQIVHGMAEHRKRYTHFARFLVDLGFAVYAEDHRGHGDTAGTLNTSGYFAETDGWNVVLNDIHQLSRIAVSEHPGLPLFLFGHSMGSALARDYITSWGHELSGCVLSGTMGNPGPALNAGIWLARRQIVRKGAKSQSFRLDRMTFGSYNSRFKPASTKFDWLSRDDREVANYIADPYCGAVFTAGFFLDFFGGIKKIFARESIESIPLGLPILLISGQSDPVGGFGRGPRQVAHSYEHAGIRDVTLKLYPDGRHEMLHELNKAEVSADIASWMKDRIGMGVPAAVTGPGDSAAAGKQSAPL